MFLPFIVALHAGHKAFSTLSDHEPDCVLLIASLDVLRLMDEDQLLSVAARGLVSCGGQR